MSTSITKQTLHSALVATIVCSVFIGATYLHAEWSNPPSNPPDGNVAAPINVSDSVQAKDGEGMIGAYRLFADNRIHSLNNVRAGNNVWAENNVRAENFVISENQMRSNLYCDRWGNDCVDVSELGGGESCEVCHTSPVDGEDYCQTYDHHEVWGPNYNAKCGTYSWWKPPPLHQCQDGDVVLVQTGRCLESGP